MTGNAPVSDSMCRGVRVPGSRRGGRGPVANAGWASVDAGARVLRGEGVVAPEVTAPRRTICPLWIYKLWVEGEDDPVAAFRAVRADRSRDLVEIDDRKEKKSCRTQRSAIGSRRATRTTSPGSSRTSAG